jgi:TolB-like protein/Tfp pilus assembly protein PilF
MRQLLSELRRRNVFRVAVAYVVAGWVIAQIADLAADAFAAPDWFMRMLIVLLLLGLPLALFLSWAYELTPAGVVRADELPLDAPKDPRAGKRLNAAIIAGLAVAVVGLLWDKFSDDEQELDIQAQNVVADKSIAVLPFADFSPGSDQGWFADGLTDEILNALARVPDLRVASRTSTFALRDSAEEIPAIAERLGVAHILEGSVRRAGDRLRVTAQLIRASDDMHLWSETYDGSAEDSIKIQEDISVAIGRALQTAMDPEELAEMIAAGTRSVEAWEIYLKAQDISRKARYQLDTDFAPVFVAEMRRAIEIDPDFSQAHLSLAVHYLLQLDPTRTLYDPSGPALAERRQLFNAAVDEAIRTAQNEPDRLTAASLKANAELRLLDDIAVVQQQLQLSPDNLGAWNRLFSLYMSIGDTDQARETVIAASAVQPEPGARPYPHYMNMQRVDPEAGAVMADEALAVPGTTAIEYYQAHRAYLAAGQNEKAAPLIRAFERLSDDRESALIMGVRQACAEGRVADADKIFAEVAEDSNSRWLFLKTLGLHEEARETLVYLDNPATLSSLAGFLIYPMFDHNEFPLLKSELESQDINRPPGRSVPYQCKR